MSCDRFSVRFTTTTGKGHGSIFARPLIVSLTVALTVLALTALPESATASADGATVAAQSAAGTTAGLPPIAAAAPGASAASLPVVQPDATGLSSFDLQVLDALNSHRAALQLSPLTEAKGLDGAAASWSATMSTAGSLQHNASAWDQLTTTGAAARSAFGENVASWTDSTVTGAAVVDKYLTNVSNAANINDPALKYVGINTKTVAGASWNTLTLVDAVDTGNAYDPALRSIPVGQLTSAAVTGATVRVAGWGLDLDAAGSAIQVKVTDTAPDGTTSASTVSADVAGAEVPATFAAAGSSHGFAVVNNISGRGLHQLCAQLINTGAGSTNPSLGCLPVHVGGMVGALETAGVTDLHLTLGGWAVDYDNPRSPTDVSITDSGPNGVVTSVVHADRSDSRVDTAIPGVGALHAFSADSTVTGAGTHTVCATAVSAANSSLTQSLGCRTVTVTLPAPPTTKPPVTTAPPTTKPPVTTAPPTTKPPVTTAPPTTKPPVNTPPVVPVGAIASTSNTVTTLTVNGWALDPRNAAAASSVQLKLVGPKGAVGAPVMRTANAVSAASLAKFPKAGNHHGFTTTWRIPAVGNYQVCATARSLAGSAATTNLGCRTVVVSNLQGWLDVVAPGKGTVSIRGWALDSMHRTSTATATITITGTNGSRKVVRVPANKLRADVGRAFPGVGNYHGFSVAVAIGRGVQKVCMSMTAMTNATTRAVRCITVTIR